MPFDRWHRPVVQRLPSDPPPAGWRTALLGNSTDWYVRAGFIVFFAVLLIALVALLAGGSGNSKRKTATNNLSLTRAALATSAPTASVPPGGIPGLKPMIVRGSVASEDSGALAVLQDPAVLVGVEGGGCRAYSVSATAAAFTATLPGGCAVDGARIHFQASGTDPATGKLLALQPVCVRIDGRSSSSLAYAAGASVEVQLRPGCDQSAVLTFVPPQPAVPDRDTSDQADLATRAAPGFPGGVHSDRAAAVLALAPGFPGGVQANVEVAVAQPPSATPPGPIPTPPSLAGMPSPGGGAVPTPAVPTPVSPVTAAAGGFPLGAGSAPTSPPIAIAPSAPPVFNPPASGLPASASLPLLPPPGGPPVPGVPSSLPGALAPVAMTLNVTVLGREGALLTGPRVQALSGSTICADETATDVAAESVQLSLPGACKELAAGSPIAFRAAGFDAQTGPIGFPATACSTVSDASGAATDSYVPVDFQPGAAGQTVSLLLRGSQSLSGCPSDDGAAPGAMSLSLTVSAAETLEPVTSPVVRVYVAGKQCAEGASATALVAHVSLPAACGKPGDLLAFEAGSQDGGEGTEAALSSACSYELAFDEATQPVAAYQPVVFAPGQRSVSLLLASLSDCPDAGSQAPAPAVDSAMTLRLSVVDPALPGAPLERPTVTAYVAAKACVRASSTDTQEIVLTLPRSCGESDAPVSFRVTALDPRFSQDGDTPACPILLPSPRTTARSFQPAPRSVAFRPGATEKYGLLPSVAVCATPTSPTPTPGPSAAPTATPTPTPASATPTATVTPSPVPATTALAATAPAATAPAATAPVVPTPTAMRATSTPAVPPQPTATPVAIRTPELPGAVVTRTVPP